jgi:hypothetical protein
VERLVGNVLEKEDEIGEVVHGHPHGVSRKKILTSVTLSDVVDVSKCPPRCRRSFSSPLSPRPSSPPVH